VAFISIRELTARCFVHWARLAHARVYHLPNCIDQSRYGIGQKRSDLLEHFGIKDKTVIMTSGRLDEKRKGFDEILEVLSDLRKRIPNVVYLILGDGADRERLNKKAEKLGVRDIVVFTGYVAEEEKADYYRLADVFAMPGSERNFDRYPYRFVFLEALACGVSVVGCRIEDEFEANDPYAQKLIIQVDPNNKQEIIQGILKALSIPKRIHPDLSNFHYDVFSKKLSRIIDDLMSVP
jgi:glycosyltransferase involved in cell wall biosynthesis